MTPHIEADGRLDPIERYFFRHEVIPQTRAGILGSRHLLRYLEPDFGLTNDQNVPFIYPDFGPGRVDTFNSVKALRLKIDMRPEHWVGTNDFPSVWLQRLRVNRFAHWDGNTDSIQERNISAALGVGAEPDTIDLPGIKRVHEWLLDLAPPPYPFPIDLEKAGRGERHYLNKCADCHGYRKGFTWQGSVWEPRGTGQVVPIKDIGTDEHRLNSFSEELASRTTEIGKGKPWQFKHFRKTNGYVNQPLDGIWARAPYFHNGSVATLWQVLTPEERSASFYRGSDAFDTAEVGFVFEGPVARKRGRLLDTTLPGNRNSGHSGPAYGTELPEAEK
jgi:hypothetical protein